MSAVSSPAGLRTMTEYMPSSWRSAPSMVKIQWPLVLSTWTRPSESVSTWTTNQNHLLKIHLDQSQAFKFNSEFRQSGTDHRGRSNITCKCQNTQIPQISEWSDNIHYLLNTPLVPMNGWCLPFIFKLYTLQNLDYKIFTHLVDTVVYRVVCGLCEKLAS